MPINKKKIQEIVNVFETGTKVGKYDAIAVYKDGPRIDGKAIYQITYGRSQTTEFGNLGRLIEMYISKNGIYASAFAEYLAKIGKIPSLRHDQRFRSLLKEAANNDPVMRTAQDEFFDRYYYQPAKIWFEGHGFKENLSLLVVYDSFIHSGGIFNFLRKRFSEYPPVNGGREKVWIKQYVETRHNWLAKHNRPILRKTIYRTQCLLTQIESNNWGLSAEINTNGVAIS
ncbi:chitosanase [Lewinella sp. W8]|uniref:chitosanase n=1 Tax=Lewinella sp. W8 TaxID=2528208 RepID=UPI00106869FF|nr:chitosanase [Lewinella sp. W8]MTB51767.1 peptidoglycan-binding protein [Lewinella sp. W8]